MDVSSDVSHFDCTVQTAGRGVFAFSEIAAGAFICEYHGELISGEDGDARERDESSCYRYFFNTEARNIGRFLVFFVTHFLSLTLF